MLSLIVAATAVLSPSSSSHDSLPRPIASSELRFLKEYFQFRFPPSHPLNSTDGDSDKALLTHIASLYSEALQSTANAHLYRCVRELYFLEPRIVRSPIYAEVLKKRNALPQSDRYVWVDCGCGPGTDVRKIIVDGWPKGDVIPLDVTEELWNIGLKLYGEEQKGGCPCTLTVDNITKDTFGPSHPLFGAASVVSSVSVLHTMDSPTIHRYLKGCRSLLSPKGSPFGVLFGSTVGTAGEPTEWTFANAAGSTVRWLHNAKSLKALLESVGFRRVSVVEGSTELPGRGSRPFDNEPIKRAMLTFEAYIS